nr:hypothetical protein [Eubacterium sp.]
ALSFSGKDEPRGITGDDEERANYDVASKSLTDLKHYTSQEMTEALTYFEKFAPGNTDMNRIAYNAIATCMYHGWS